MIDTFNKFLVGVQGNQIAFLKMVPPRISKEDALLLAAYLVSLADDEDKFSEYLQAVQNT